MKLSTCRNCNKNYLRGKSSLGIYCSNKCQGEFKYKESIKNWLSGDKKGWSGKTRRLSSFIRRWLKETRGSKCSKCGWDEKHPLDNNSLTEINHIDGNAESCNPLNLEILCPNCHSMTINFKNRNKISKRKR